jgi:DNA-binding MarR family transcriptional regulator
MQCYTCNKPKDKKTCAACREVLKIDMVKLLLELDPVYLSEGTRNKRGRPHKLNATQRHDAWYAHNHQGVSIGKLAKKYGVSKGTIHRIVQSTA